MHKVLIVGAGMGGLALAQALRKQRVPFEIFEREAGPYDRSQGWAIGLSWSATLGYSLPEPTHSIYSPGSSMIC